MGAKEIRLGKGSEADYIYLPDGSKRLCIRHDRFEWPIKPKFASSSIPLASFDSPEDYGLSLMKEGLLP